jgi:peptidoglycan hydrolase-like protein with peptidoglycan-binding domain
MLSLIEALPIIPRVVQLAPQIQQALRLGQPALDASLATAPDLMPLLQEIGKSLFPGIANQLSHVAGAQALFDPTGVKWIQLALNLLGANPQLVVDGRYGPATRAAVTKFQTEHSLVVDGWAGEATGNALRAALATLKT